MCKTSALFKFNPLVMLVAVALVAASSTSRASSVVVDFDSQALGTLQGQAGPAGTTNNWGGASAAKIIDGQMVAPYALPQNNASNHIVTSLAANTITHCYTTLNPPMTGVVYFSYLSQLLDSNDRVGITFNKTDTTMGSKLDVLTVATAGDANNVTVADVRTRNASASLAAASGYANNFNLPNPGNVHFYLGKIEFNVHGTGDRISVWVDPDLSSQLPAAKFGNYSGQNASEEIEAQDFFSSYGTLQIGPGNLAVCWKPQSFKAEESPASRSPRYER